jgi:cyclopropane fatty-acyl-phospholipid synthase-like methyltransferase
MLLPHQGEALILLNCAFRFPGGYCPARLEVLPAVEKARLRVTDIEILRLHDAQTIARWRTLRWQPQGAREPL